MEFTTVCPERNLDNPDISSLCKHMLSWLAYAGASCACSAYSRSAQPQQACFGKQVMIHGAGEGSAGGSIYFSLHKATCHTVINGGSGFALHKRSVSEQSSHQGLPFILSSADGTRSEDCACPQGNRTIPVHAAPALSSSLEGHCHW